MTCGMSTGQFVPARNPVCSSRCSANRVELTAGGESKTNARENYQSRTDRENRSANPAIHPRNSSRGSKWLRFWTEAGEAFLQARIATTCRLVQGPRSVCELADAGGSRSRSCSSLGGQSWRSGGIRSQAAEQASEDLCSACGFARKAGKDSKLWGGAHCDR